MACSCCCITTTLIGIVVSAALAYVRWLYASAWKAKGLKGKYVLITGCDTGFGRMTTLQLAKKEIKVLAACLSQSSVEELKKVANVIPFVMDVSKDDSVEAAFNGVIKSNVEKDGLWAVINNAGVLRTGQLELMPLDQWKFQFEINVFGLVRVTQRAIPFLRKIKGSRVVNIASVAGRFALGGSSAYAATKFSVEALSDALRRELKFFGIQVVIMEPGVMKTALWDEPLKEAERSFEACNQYQKEVYGKQFFVNGAKGFVEFVRTKGGNPQRVVDNLDNAVTAQWPLHRYTVGSDGPMWLFLATAPSCVGDFLVGLDSKKYGMIPAKAI